MNVSDVYCVEFDYGPSQPVARVVHNTQALDVESLSKSIAAAMHTEIESLKMHMTHLASSLSKGTLTDASMIASPSQDVSESPETCAIKAGLENVTKNASHAQNGICTDESIAPPSPSTEASVIETCPAVEREECKETVSTEEDILFSKLDAIGQYLKDLRIRRKMSANSKAKSDEEKEYVVLKDN
eukprot:Nk52_evm7s225 gene=Nk52_evmTU7s225